MKTFTEWARRSLKINQSAPPCRWWSQQSQLPPRSTRPRPRNTPLSKLSPEDALARGMERERFLVHRRMSHDKEIYDEDIVNMSAEVNFKLRTPRGYKHGILTRRYLNERIEVRFLWDFSKQESWEGSRNPLRRKLFPVGYGSYTFNVRVHIPDKGHISVDCVSLMGDGLSVQDFQYFPNYRHIVTDAYSGRLYRKLTLEFHRGLLAYLRDRGIDDKFCKYLVAISDQRGFDEDILWTTQISRFLGQK